VAKTPKPAAKLFSLGEIAGLVGIKENTVKGHFNVYTEIFSPEKGLGPRGKRAFAIETLEKYKMFLTLKGDTIRLTSSEAAVLLRGGNFDKLKTAQEAGISQLILLVQKLRSGTKGESHGQ
jgi:hypothetical protein